MYSADISREKSDRTVTSACLSLPPCSWLRVHLSPWRRRLHLPASPLPQQQPVRLRQVLHHPAELGSQFPVQEVCPVQTSLLHRQPVGRAWIDGQVCASAAIQHGDHQTQAVVQANVPQGDHQRRGSHPHQHPSGSPQGTRRKRWERWECLHSTLCRRVGIQ